MSKKDAKKLLQEWVDKQGHDRCWYYPDIFKQLCEELDVKSVNPILPTRAEFEQGCGKYQNEQFGETAKPTITAKVYLAEIGYQIDLLDENGKEIASTCRDFGGDYPPEKMADVVAAGMLATMEKVEGAYQKTFRKEKQ